MATTKTKLTEIDQIEPKLRISGIEMVPIVQLVPHPRNPNMHSDDQVERLAQIIEWQGWRYPVKVSNQSGFVTSGHGRILAAKLRGWNMVPVSRQDYENEAQEYADIVSDNAIAEWAQLDLSSINTEVTGLGPDFDIDLLGIKDFVLEPAEKLAPGCEDDEVPGIRSDTICKPGDLWILGSHRLMCGDSTNILHVEQLMEGKKADMVFTDPPYNVNYGADNAKHPSWKSHDRTIMNDHMSAEEFKDFCRAFISCIVASTEGCVFVFGPPGPDGRIMFTECDQAMHCSTTIVWKKDRFVLGRGKYHNQYEPCWFGWVASGSSFTEDRTLSNVWEFPRPQKSELHPTMKPVELVEQALNHACPKGGLILDLFGGSGTTMIAAEKSNRSANLMELDPKYCDVIIARWQKYSGQTAELVVSNGQN